MKLMHIFASGLTNSSNALTVTSVPIPHSPTFIYTTNISKVSKGLRDVLLGYNLGFKSRIRPCKNYHSWGQFFWKNIGVGRFFEIVDKMSKIEKSWYHLISFDTLRKDTLHTQKTVLLHHLSSKVDLCPVIYILLCSEIHTFRI